MADCDDARKRALRAEYVGRINRVLDYIEAHLDGDLSLRALAHVANFSEFHFHRVFKGVMGGWLPQSGYQCDDRPCFEIYQNDPKEHPEGKCVVDICVPVKPL